MKNQAKTKHHPQAEVSLFENYLLSSSTLSSKNNRAYSKIINKCPCFNMIISLIIKKIKMKMKNGSHRYDINRSGPKHGHIHTKYKVSRYDDP